MKVYDYIIVFKRPGYRLIDGISQFMLLLAMLVFSWTLSTTAAPTTGQIILFIVLIGCIIGWWIYCYRQLKQGSHPFFRLALLVAAAGWFMQVGLQMVAVVYLLAVILEKQAKFPQEVAFDKESVVVNSFPKKYFYWKDIANVVLKDGILTIDFHNNKLIQKEIETQASIKLEEEFNDFCRHKLNA